ncbi:aminodeoxychorismate lyase family protein [Candidatus Endolissoclinum faulkneri L2]|uniref:Endolytic murein transglycosylase n=1 Tax=Candidatus Endolissoclinum faulkneri L2 TaxID=1193729 RepID=K7Z4D9_9PROT|nr:endolytic transglycosylase MltG [Candidatus Endolissoclinum faulkneri]AFX98878.1 aminodeoxychorismate lyase family protein [Candidatus Endolissoclinum faulkneri L2]
MIKRAKNDSRLFFLAWILFSLAFFTRVAFWFWTEFTQPGPLIAKTNVVIPVGSSIKAIACRLMEAGVISHISVFALVAEVTGKAGILKAGEFAFPAAVSQQSVFEILERGIAVVHHLTVAEGLSSIQVVAIINATEGLNGEIHDIPLEGTLLPETYYYAYGDKRADTVNRMRIAMDKKVHDLWKKRDQNLPIANPKEALILASIVEKETKVEAERPLVASVFVNRLKFGMRLQADTTVVYGISRGKYFSRPLNKSDLREQTPYNTYIIAGLPPGPIANPGVASIVAVLQPAKTDYLYFVADGTGGHAFSNTLVGHNRNVRDWRKQQKKNI